MSFPNRDAQILAHILEYCNRIEKTLSRFGREFDVFLDDQDYMDSVSMNLLQIGELAGKFSDAYVQKTKPQMDWRAIKNMRNMFAHDYGSMDKDRIWQTATVSCMSISGIPNRLKLLRIVSKRVRCSHIAVRFLPSNLI